MIYLNHTLMLLMFSCDNEQTDTSSVCSEAEQVEWNYWAKGFFDTYCRGCHSSEALNRFGAPEQINFDSEDEVFAQADEIYSSVIIRQTMPKGGGLEPQLLESLAVYLQCWGSVSYD